MRKFGMRLGLGIGVALLARTAPGPVSLVDETRAAGRGAWVGVSTRILSEDWREHEEYWASGVMVAEVAPGSPAELAGMGPGDVLVCIDSHTLRNPGDFAEAQDGMEPGRPVSVVLARDGGRVIRIFNLEPGPLPGGAAGESGAAASEAVPTPPATREHAATAALEPVVASQPAPAEARPNGATELGVRCENLNLDLAAALGAPEGQGVLVLEVKGGSPADGAEIRPGDVISWAGGQPVADVDGLDRIIATAHSPVSIVTLRRGTARHATAEFAAPVAPGGSEPGMSSQRADDVGHDPLVMELRDEVRSLREELRKLREQLADLTRRSAGRQP